MKLPPIKPSSVPSLHRYTHTHTHVALVARNPVVASLMGSSSPLLPPLCPPPHHTLQDTLAYATALLNEKEQSGSSNGSDGSPANENAERSLRQVAPGLRPRWPIQTGSSREDNNRLRRECLPGFCLPWFIVALWLPRRRTKCDSC